MRFLYVGDVVGKPGRAAVFGLVPGLRRERNLDAVVVNCENAAGGKGITPELADELLTNVADVLTSGNHVWHYREIKSYLEHEPRLIRPANYPRAPGKGSYVLTLKDGRRFGVLQVEGRVFMRNLDCPFLTLDKERQHLGKVEATLVDVHAEATSEKQALGWHFAGQFSAIIGSHTHVQTADERILPGGTAFLTDVGMTGPHESVIGMQKEAAIDRFLTQRAQGHDLATGDVRLSGVIIDTDDATGKAKSIERLHLPWPG
jgi:2',3'-cyclic-nucleotide 2'-phosphodiesterase